MPNMKEKGQMSIEIIGIAVIVVALLLLVFVATTSKNIESNQILAIGKNSIQCNTMSSVIARMYNNRAITQETLNLETETRIRRVEGKPGGINVEGISCNYMGSVAMNPADGRKDTDPNGTGETGMTLGMGNWCFEKDSDTNVVLTQGECT